MALVIEDGTGVTGAESYVDVAYANTYWSNRNNTVWRAATSPAKEAALRAACQYLDNAYDWIGSRLVAYQPLSWPRALSLPARHMTWVDTKYLIPGISTVPDIVKQAQCELALEALSGSLLPSLDRGGQISSETVGSISVTYAPGAPGTKRYPLVDVILKPIITGRTVGSVTGTAVRA